MPQIGPPSPSSASDGRHDHQQAEQLLQNIIQLAATLGPIAKNQRQARNQTQPKDRKQRDSAGTFWLLGLIPITLACLHLVIVSRGDAETLRSLTENLNVTALVLSTVLPLLTSAITWVYLFVLLASLGRRSNPKRTKPSTLLIWGAIVALIDAFAMPLKYIAINAVFLGVLVGIFGIGLVIALVRPQTLGKRVTNWVGRLGKWFSVALLTGPVIVWMALLGVWMPQERLTIGATQLSPVYVLSSDVRWTKYMDADHKVHLVPTQEIARRQMVGKSQSVWHKTPVAIWHGQRVGHVPDPAVPRVPATTATQVNPQPSPATPSSDRPG
ncbi:hypothetical protein [Gordonia hankookensis]|uniref:Uncharacterized protein n=1 Tax=Gordonia hankookensis TaxID=589403 RepID=A0ABR7WH11_9ACTN|nr:hypothetical protein [Gordonia hankookensis]MBD1321856.1 hypothetical protein [Gordonia hankookensis]